MELTPQQAEREWAAGRFQPVYCLCGEDALARSELAAKLKAALSPDPFNYGEFAGGSDPREIVSAALTPPMFAERRLVLVQGGPGAEAKKALATYLADPLPSTTLLLHCEDRKPDLRDALIAAVAALGGLVVLRPLREEEARARLLEASAAAGLPMDEEAADLVVEEAGTSWPVLRSELEKMLTFCRGKGRVRREHALLCLGYRRTSNPFDFPRALQSRDALRSLRLLRRLLDEGVEPFRLLYQVAATLQKQLKARRLEAAGVPEPQIFRELRLQSYYDRDFMRWVRAQGEPALAAGLRACLELETRLKSQPWLNPGAELERLVAALCAGRPAAGAARKGPGVAAG